MYTVEKEKCANCGYCAFVCPFDALIHHVDEKYYEIDQQKCKQCGQCYLSCVAVAIDCSEDQMKAESVAINKDKCIGCSLCSRACPIGAISGIVKQPFVINQAKCIKCGVCVTKCKKDAIDVAWTKAKKTIKSHKLHDNI